MSKLTIEVKKLKSGMVEVKQGTDVTLLTKEQARSLADVLIAATK